MVARAFTQVRFGFRTEFAAISRATIAAGEANGLAIAPVLLSATHEQKKKYLGRMTEECLMAAYW